PATRTARAIGLRDCSGSSAMRWLSMTVPRLALPVSSSGDSAVTVTSSVRAPIPSWTLIVAVWLTWSRRPLRTSFVLRPPRGRCKVIQRRKLPTQLLFFIENGSFPRRDEARVELAGSLELAACRVALAKPLERPAHLVMGRRIRLENGRRAPE